jgi:hypothetical protein
MSTIYERVENNLELKEAEERLNRFHKKRGELLTLHKKLGSLINWPEDAREEYERLSGSIDAIKSSPEYERLGRIYNLTK